MPRGVQNKRLGKADPEWQRKVREKIKTSQIINRLADHIHDKAEMTSTQIRAAEILLKKALPDLSSVEMTGDADNPIHHDVNVNLIKAKDRK